MPDSEFRLLRETGIAILEVCVSPNAARYKNERIIRRLKELSASGKNLEWLEDKRHLFKSFQAFRDAVTRGDDIVIVGDDPAPVVAKEPGRPNRKKATVKSGNFRNNLVWFLQQASEIQPMTRASLEIAMMETTHLDASHIREKVERELIVNLKEKGYDLRKNVRG